METFLFLLELAGTVAFAVSGAVLGIEKHMDIFGVGLLGITTAVGGGILRDLVVGLTPPRAFQDPIYLLVALGVSVVLFFPFVRRIIGRSKRVFDALMLLHGRRRARHLHDHGHEHRHHPRRVHGSAAAGVRRAADRHGRRRAARHSRRRYALYSAQAHLRQRFHRRWDPLSAPAAGLAGPGAVLTGVVVVVVIRCAAAHFEWNLPRAKTVWKSDE